MKFRNVIFWIHLSCGVITGLVILMMSATGVLLTYERQINAFFERQNYFEAAQGLSRRPFSYFIESTRAYTQGISPAAIIISEHPEAPVTVQVDRLRRLYFNPYSGAILGEGVKGVREFFHLITGWHRWFNVEGEGRETARMVTGACNLVFLFLIISGMYLWLPRRLKWPFFRSVLFFNPGTPTARARDYNWHHVFGFWSSIPLIVVVSTAVVFSYSWANSLVFRSFGEEPPRRELRGPPGFVENRTSGTEGARSSRSPDMPPAMTLDTLFDRAAAYLDGWKTISMVVPRDPGGPVTFTLDLGNGGQPQKRHQLTLNRLNGELVRWEPFDSQSAGRKARVFIRFLHTGEALGIIGQTLAGLVSLTSLIMVWTGIALAYRRLIQPLFKKN